jgi:hypothetical protein
MKRVIITQALHNETVFAVGGLRFAHVDSSTRVNIAPPRSLRRLLIVTPKYFVPSPRTRFPFSQEVNC